MYFLFLFFDLEQVKVFRLNYISCIPEKSKNQNNWWYVWTLKCKICRLTRWYGFIKPTFYGLQIAEYRSAWNYDEAFERIVNHVWKKLSFTDFWQGSKYISGIHEILWAKFDKKVPLNFDKWSVKKERTEAATGHVL